MNPSSRRMLSRRRDSPIACPRRRFLGTVAAAAAATGHGHIGRVAGAAEAAVDRWQPRWILASALYGNVPLAEILPEVAKTGAGMIDLWPKPHGTQREEVDALGADRVREMLATHNVKLGGMACYMVGPFNLAGEFAVAKRLGAESPVLMTMAPGDGSATGDVLTAAIKTFLAKLEPSLAAAEAAGGVIAIENHSHSLLQTPEGIRRFAEIAKHERVGIALAPHHLPQDAELIASLAHDLGPKLKFVYAQQHGKGAKEKLPKEEELLQMPGRGPFDFGPLMRALADMRFGGPIEIFMHPVPRGVPILDSVQAITTEVNRARDCLERTIG
jgi:sugar phosphate isomerase/epimerase